MKPTKTQKKQAKRDFKIRQRRRELAPIAVKVCDKMLGSIPRVQETLDALEVVRLLIESSCGETEMTERQGRIHQHMDHEFAERFLDIMEWHYMEDIPEGMDEAYQDAYCWMGEQVHLAFELAHKEVERRDNYGQNVEAQLEELTERLIAEMT